MLNRRGLLLGLASALAAPAIVHAGNLMPVRAIYPRTIQWAPGITWTELSGHEVELIIEELFGVVGFCGGRQRFKAVNPDFGGEITALFL